MFWNVYIWVLAFSQCTCCGPLLTTAVQEMVQNFSTLSKSHNHPRKMPDRGSCSKMGLQNYIQELIYFFQPALWMISQGKTWKGKKCLCVISLVRVCFFRYIFGTWWWRSDHTLQVNTAKNPGVSTAFHKLSPPPNYRFEPSTMRLPFCTTENYAALKCSSDTKRGGK